MDNRPIGFFDSGLGGLTCIAPLMTALPNEQIIYFGDTARTPYGSKAASTIRAFSSEIADFLVQMDVKMIVIACNTVSATCLPELSRRYPGIPVIGIIQPAARAVVQTCSVEQPIGIIGTKVTIKSGAYEKQIQALHPGFTLRSAACPALVPLIEEGIIENDIMDLTVRYYLDHFIHYHHIRTLVLGCTHYPLIRPNIEKLYPGLNIIDPSREITATIEQTLTERGMLAERETPAERGMLAERETPADAPPPDHMFYASDLSENFINMINRISTGTGFRVAFKSFDPDWTRPAFRDAFRNADETEV